MAPNVFKNSAHLLLKQKRFHMFTYVKKRQGEPRVLVSVSPTHCLLPVVKASLLIATVCSGRKKIFISFSIARQSRKNSHFFSWLGRNFIVALLSRATIEFFLIWLESEFFLVFKSKQIRQNEMNKVYVLFILAKPRHSRQLLGGKNDFIITLTHVCIARLSGFISYSAHFGRFWHAVGLWLCLAGAFDSWNKLRSKLKLWLWSQFWDTKIFRYK